MMAVRPQPPSLQKQPGRPNFSETETEIFRQGNIEWDDWSRRVIYSKSADGEKCVLAVQTPKNARVGVAWECELLSTKGLAKRGYQAHFIPLQDVVHVNVREILRCFAYSQLANPHSDDPAKALKTFDYYNDLCERSWEAVNAAIDRLDSEQLKDSTSSHIT